MLSTTTIVPPQLRQRSSMEEMLEAVKGREDRSRDSSIPPVLPMRPTSKARPPSAVRTRKFTQTRFNQSNVEVPSDVPPVDVQGICIDDQRENMTNVEPAEGDPLADGSCNGASEVNAERNKGSIVANKPLFIVMPNIDSEMAGDALKDKQGFKRTNNRSPVESPYKKPAGTFEDRSGDSDDSEVGSYPASVEDGRKWTDDSVSGMKKECRTWCMVSDREWTLGVIQSTSGEESNVILSNGNIVTVSTSMLLPANPDILEGVDDLIQLSYLNEPSVLHNLQHRYVQDMIYTKAGPVLVAINPFKDVPLYGNKFIEAYRLKLRDNPHVYQMADAAFGAMVRDGVNQSIIIR